MNDPAAGGEEPQLALVEEIWATVTLDRDIPAGDSLKATPLGARYAAYEAELLGASRVRLGNRALQLQNNGRIELDAAGDPIPHTVHMPRFKEGELLLARWTAGGARVAARGRRWSPL